MLRTLIAALVVELTPGGTHEEILTRAQRAQRAPAERAMRIFGLSVRGKVWGLLRDPLHQRNQGLALKCWREGQTQHAKQSRSHVHQPHSGRNAPSRKQFTRKLEEQRHADGLIVQKYPMHALTMRAQRFAVIRHDRDQRSVIQAALAEVGEQLA